MKTFKRAYYVLDNSYYVSNLVSGLEFSFFHLSIRIVSTNDHPVGLSSSSGSAAAGNFHSILLSLRPASPSLYLGSSHHHQQQHHPLNHHHHCHHHQHRKCKDAPRAPPSTLAHHTIIVVIISTIPKTMTVVLSSPSSPASSSSNPVIHSFLVYMGCSPSNHPPSTSEKRKRRKEMIIWYGEVIPIYQLCLSQSTYGEGKNIQRSHKRHGNHRHPRDKVREIPQRETEIPSQSKSSVSSDKEQMSSAHLKTASQSLNS